MKLTCDYCGMTILEKYYPFYRNYKNRKSVYCIGTNCSSRASLLRMARKNEKYMPNLIDEIDKTYMKKQKELKKLKDEKHRQE